MEYEINTKYAPWIATVFGVILTVAEKNEQ